MLKKKAADAKAGRLSHALRGFQVDSLRSARIRLDVKRNALTFVEAAHSGALNGRGVDEHVLAAAFRRDEAEALLRVEKFNSSDSQVIAPNASGSAQADARAVRGGAIVRSSEVQMFQPGAQQIRVGSDNSCASSGRNAIAILT